MSNKYERRWSAPGSLLIAGEYLVTEEGGRGLAVAAGGRAEGRVLINTELMTSPESALEMTGLWPGGGGIWSQNDINDASLASAVWKECSYSSHPEYGKRKHKIIVDTSMFFDRKGRKSGYGSSAAAALLYTRGVESSTDADGFTAEESVKISAERALRAHRIWQNSRGSGYDVLCSAFGGAGLFTGGLIPDWEPFRWPDIFDCWIIKGPGAVNSTHAVERYINWKKNINNHWKQSQLLSDISRNIQILSLNICCGAKFDSDDFLKTIHQLAILGSSLGSEIAIPARPLMPEHFKNESRSSQEPWFRPGAGAAKCLGAGNETVLLVAYKDGLSSREKSALFELEQTGSAHPLVMETAGLRIEGTF